MLHSQKVMVKNNKSILRLWSKVSLNKQCFHGEIQRYISSMITASYFFETCIKPLCTANYSTRSSYSPTYDLRSSCCFLNCKLGEVTFGWGETTLSLRKMDWNDCSSKNNINLSMVSCSESCLWNFELFCH